MTDRLREAAQAALDALSPLANAHSPSERETLTDLDVSAAHDAAAALRAALAEQHQLRGATKMIAAKPVAWIYYHRTEAQGDGRLTWLRWAPDRIAQDWIEVPLYTKPPRREHCVPLSADGQSVWVDGVGDVPRRKEWQGLTEPDIHAAYDWPVGWGYDNVRDFAFALEAVLRSKNT